MVGVILLVFLILVVIVIAFSQFASDDFECNALNCNSAEWTSNWTVTSATCNIQTQNALDTYNLRGVGGCDTYRSFDADPNVYEEVEVSFYATAQSLESADHCYYYYYNGTGYNLLLTLNNGDDDTTHDYYAYNVSQYGLSSNARIRMLGAANTGDYCYIDNVVIKGTDKLADMKIYSELNYLANQDYDIDITSELTSTNHTLQLSYNTTKFCEVNLTSPSVASTVFSANCLMPNITYINAEAFLFITNDKTQNITKTFNLVNPIQDSGKLDIDRVYFSNQVLQGGSTEIFAIIEKDSNITLDRVYTTLTFPDDSTRELAMEETINTNEYRAFITDTYLTGNVSFTIQATSNVYYDTYTNQYEIAPYNVDFVDLVNQVGEVLEVKKQTPNVMVAGTDYFSGEPGKTFLQLSEQGIEIDNATCWTTIYYPNNTIWVDHQMLIQLGDEGLQYYPFITPAIEGIYMISAECQYYTNNVWYHPDNDIHHPEQTVIYADSTTGSPINLLAKDDAYIEVDAEKSGNTYYMDLYYLFNDTEHFIANFTDMTVAYAGASTEVNAVDLYWWNWSDSSWNILPNSLTFEAQINPQSLEPVDTDLYMSNPLPDDAYAATNEIWLRVYSAHNKDFVVFNNWLNVRGDTLTTESPSFLRGGGEIHVSNAALVMVNYFDTIIGIVNETTYEANVQGTYYSVGDNGRIFLQLTENKQPINGEFCQVSIQYPNSVKGSLNYYIEDAFMSGTDVDGMYYLDTVAPDQEGVYIINAECYTGANTFRINATSDNLIEGSVTSGTLTDSYTSDDIYYELLEQNNGGNNRSYVHEFIFDGSSLPNVTNLTQTVGVIVIEGQLTPQDDETIKVLGYNWSGASWVELSNQWYSQTSGIDTISSLIPGSGVAGGTFKNASGHIRIKLQDTHQVTDTSTSTIKIDRIILGQTEKISETVTVAGGGEWNIRDGETGISFIGGTEYNEGDDGKISLRLIRGSGSSTQPEIGASCNVSVFNPSMTKIVDDVSMIDQGWGIYYYNFTVGSDLGVYTYYTDCVKTPRKYFSMNTYHVYELNVTATVDLSSVLAQLTIIENYLTSLITNIDEFEQFTEEQIYLITDSVVTLGETKTNLDTGKITEGEAKTIVDDVINNKLSFLSETLYANELPDEVQAVLLSGEPLPKKDNKASTPLLIILGLLTSGIVGGGIILSNKKKIKLKSEGLKHEKQNISMGRASNYEHSNSASSRGNNPGREQPELLDI